MNRLRLLLLPSLLLVSGLCTLVRAAERPPNIVLIFADDLGPGLLSCNGQKLLTTPNIDRLAAEGMRFDNYYGAVYCAPARWTLLTGMHDGRDGGWSQSRAGLPMWRDSGAITQEDYEARMEKLKAGAHPIATNEVFLAEVARKAGYKTAQFGKLDRGFLTWHERVKRFGWDHYEGMYDHQRCHGFYPPYIWRNGQKIDLPGNPNADCGKQSEKGDAPVGSGGKTYSQNVFLKGILRYIRDHGAALKNDKETKPFFLYHPTQLPHGPVAIPELHPDLAKNEGLTLGEKKYGSMVMMLDDHVGQIMAELKTQGLDENTVVFFTSDNGHELYYGPKFTYKQQKNLAGEKLNLTDKKWRSGEIGDVFDGAGDRAGLKRSGYQGGMQCPLIARWPGRIKPGTRTDHLSAHYDFLATVAELGGVDAPAGKDSISYLPTLLGKPQVIEHDVVVVKNQWSFMGGNSLITKDGFKLVEIQGGEVQLYHILDDNAERHEISAKHPERVATLKKRLKAEINSPRPDLVAAEPADAP